MAPVRLMCLCMRMRIVRCRWSGGIAMRERLKRGRRCSWEGLVRGCMAWGLVLVIGMFFFLSFFFFVFVFLRGVSGKGRGEGEEKWIKGVKWDLVGWMGLIWYAGRLAEWSNLDIRTSGGEGGREALRTVWGRAGWVGQAADNSMLTRVFHPLAFQCYMDTNT